MGSKHLTTPEGETAPRSRNTEHLETIQRIIMMHRMEKFMHEETLKEHVHLNGYVISNERERNIMNN